MRTAAATQAHTYVVGESDETILDFVHALQRRGREVPEVRPALLDAEGRRHEFPEPIFDVLMQVAESLVSGMGVTVAPRNARLTTQEAADFLGVSRPTLVRMLERGDIPMEKPGRHRYVRLDDLVEFQEKHRSARRATLDQMQTDGTADGLYDATDGVVPPHR